MSDNREDDLIVDAPDPTVETYPPRPLPTFKSPGGPRMMALVGGTLRYDRGCFFVGGEGEGPRRLVIWPEGVRAGEDSSGPYVDTGETRLRPGEVFESGGGEVPIGDRDAPDDCRTEQVIIAYGPYRPDAVDRPPPPEPSPPPSAPPPPGEPVAAATPPGP